MMESNRQQQQQGQQQQQKQQQQHWARRSVRLGALLQRRLSSFRSKQVANQQQYQSPTLLATSVADDLRRVSSPSAPLHNGIVNRPGPFRLRRDSSQPFRSHTASSDTDGFKVRRASTLVQSPITRTSDSSFMDFVRDDGDLNDDNDNDEFEIDDEDEIEDEIECTGDSDGEEEEEDSVMGSLHQSHSFQFSDSSKFQTRRSSDTQLATFRSSHSPVRNIASPLPEFVPQTDKQKQATQLTIVKRAVNHTTVAPPPPPQSSLPPSSSTSHTDPSHQFEQEKQEQRERQSCFTHCIDKSSSACENQIRGPSFNISPSLTSAPSRHTVQPTHSTVTASANKENRVKQLSTIFQRNEEPVPSPSTSSVTCRTFKISKRSKSINHSQTRTQLRDEPQPQSLPFTNARPSSYSSKILDLVAKFDGNNVAPSQPIQSDGDGENDRQVKFKPTDQPMESADTESHLDHQYAGCQPEYWENEQTNSIRHKQPERNGGEYDKEFGPTKYDDITTSDHENELALEHSLMSEVSIGKSHRPQRLFHDIDDRTTQPNMLSTSMSWTMTPNASHTARVNSSHSYTSPDASITECDSTVLDFSPVERYRSMSARAELVANALERIGKRVDEFAERHDDEGIAPREAIIPLMIEGMQQHRNDCKVADRALSTLRRLTVSEKCRTEIGQCGGIEAVVSIMRCHSSLVRIQTQACLTLANLAYQNKSNKDTVMRCGGLQAIVSALSHHRDVENVQTWGCLALRNFTNHSGSRRQDASIATEAIDVLLFAMEEYPRSSLIQQNCMIALMNIATASAYGIDKIRENGGIQTLVGAMHGNVRSTKLSEIALCLIRLLMEDKKNQKLFGQTRGIEAITAIMNEHHEDIGIIVKGCATFRNLAFQRENREMLGKLGSLQAIVSSLSLSSEKGVDSESMGYFLKALSNATYDSIPNKTLAGRLGAVDATLKIMSDNKFRDDEQVIVDGCRALRNLVDGVAHNHRSLIRNKGIGIVLDAIRLHGFHSAGVAEHGLAVFVNMSSNRTFISQLSEESGDIPTIAQHMHGAHTQNEQVQKQAADLLNLVGSRSSGRLTKQLSGLRNSRLKSTTERNLRASKSAHRNDSHPVEEQTRLQRLRSMPLQLSRNRNELTQHSSRA